jgi:hypothetical protein
MFLYHRTGHTAISRPGIDRPLPHYFNNVIVYSFLKFFFYFPLAQFYHFIFSVFFVRISYVWVLSVLNSHMIWRMLSSGMLRLVAHVRTDVSEERSVSIIKVIRIGELGTLAVTSNRRLFLNSGRRLLVTSNVSSSPFLVALMMEAQRSSETSALIRATRRNIP